MSLTNWTNQQSRNNLPHRFSSNTTSSHDIPYAMCNNNGSSSNSGSSGSASNAENKANNSNSNNTNSSSVSGKDDIASTSGTMTNGNRMVTNSYTNANSSNMDDNEDNASSDMNEVDFDKAEADFDKNEADSSSMQGSPKADKEPKKKKSRVMSKSAALKLMQDKKKLEKYIGEGEVLVPVPRARRRVKSGDLGYMVKRGHEVVRYIDKDGVVYNPSETAYLKNKEKGKPYFVCAIQRFNLTKRDTLMVVIKWFFRLSEVPGSVYHHLTLDRELHRKNGEDIICDSSIQQRELFSSDATDNYPITSLRGKCHVVQYTDLKSTCSFVPRPDHFFYILAYRPDNRRLATTQGEIRVGPSHQARLPECRPGTSPNDMPERCESREEIRWRPNKVVDGDLLMYLRAARSIAAFAGMCGGTAEDRCEAEAMDETTVNALDTLHKHNYDTSKSMQALVKGPSVMYIERKWSEEDMKRFAKGVRHLGKNFFKIRKEHLPHKDTSELVEFYYFWKKSPAANNARPNYRSRHRRQLKRQSPRISQPDHCEASSGSDSGGEESEESDGSRDVNTICQNCFTTTSRDWHNAGTKDGAVVCSKCHLVYKKYGEESSSGTNHNLESPSPVNSGLSPYHFRPVPQDEDIAPPSKHNMRTRRSNNSVTTNGKKKERTSSPDLENSSSSISSSTAGSIRSDRKSPNNTEKDAEEKAFNQTSKDSNKSKKRRYNTEDESANKKKKEHSDSESGSESSSVSGQEGLANDGESDANIPEELSDSSRPSSPTSSIEPVRPQPTTASVPESGDKPGPITSTSLAGSNSPAPPPALGVLGKDNFSALSICGSSPSKLITSQGLPIGLNNSVQQTNPFTNTPSNIPPVLSTPSSVLVPSTASLSSSLPGTPLSHHLRSPHHPQNPNQFIRPSVVGVGPGSTGHISNIGTITNAGSHPIGNISSNTSVACNISPLVIPSPSLSRASSTGTFIPRAELAIPSLSNSTLTGTDSITTAVAKTTSVVSSVDSSTTSLPQRVQSNNPAGLGGNNNINSTIASSNINSSTNTSVNSNTNTNPFSRMQQDQPPSGDDQDKKPVPHAVPPHIPPPSFLPGHPAGVPFSPFHYYYPQHPGAPHLPPHLALHAGSSAGVPPPSSSSSSSSSSGPSPLTAPPPVPSLVPIKKEVHSPPPPLKSSTDSKPPADLLSSTSASSLHALHRSLPPSDGASKLPPCFPQPGLPSTAPLPPPPLTLIDQRDANKTADDLSKPPSDHYPKDNNMRGLNHSPHRPEGNLPPSASLLHQSRMDNNLSILSESREIGLKGGISSSSSHPQLSMSSLPPSSSSQPPPHPQLTSIKEEPNSGPSHHPHPSAAFQPYHHSHLPPNTHHPGLPQAQSSQLPQHDSASASSSVLQIPQPHISSGDHHHHYHGGLPPHHPDSNLHPSGSVSRPGELITSVKKEPVPVEEIHVDDDDDEPMGGSTTPGPAPTTCNMEFYKSNSAIFVKVFDRGERNQCSRTDFIFKPKPGSNLSKKREERARKASHPTATVSAREEKKRVETPPRATSASESQKATVCNPGNNPSSNVSNLHPGHGPPTPYQDRHTPRQFTDTPALRQLHEYARPHVLNSDPRAGPYSLGMQHHPHMDPLLGYRFGMFPPGSRERLEMELERDKRERDAREREMRERELREMELRDKMELKPGLDRLLPPGTDASWLELQRRMGFPPTAAGPLVPGHSPGAVGSHVPGVYPPSSLASDLLAREREKLDRFGLTANLPQLAADMSYASAVERLTQERQAAERQAAERERDRERLVAYANDPGARLQLASAVAATQHAHTHTHAHSHTHLHLHQQEVAAHAQAVAQAQAQGLTPPAFPLSLGGHAPPLYPHHPDGDAADASVYTTTASTTIIPTSNPSPVTTTTTTIPVASTTEHIARQMLYRYYSQHLPHNEQLYIQRLKEYNLHALAQAQAHLVDESRLLYPISRADAIAAAAGQSASALPPSSSANSLPVLPHAVVHHPLLAGIANREELLQREIYSRSGQFIDPALAHQLSAQAAAHEALQRQIAMERERYGSSGHMPH